MDSIRQAVDPAMVYVEVGDKGLISLLNSLPVSTSVSVELIAITYPGREYAKFRVGLNQQQVQYLQQRTLQEKYGN